MHLSQTQFRVIQTLIQRFVQTHRKCACFLHTDSFQCNRNGISDLFAQQIASPTTSLPFQTKQAMVLGDRSTDECPPNDNSAETQSVSVPPELRQSNSCCHCRIVVVVRFVFTSSADFTRKTGSTYACTPCVGDSREFEGKQQVFCSTRVGCQ